MATTIFGPRGCPAHEPENSPAGFRYALTHGAEGIETDLHLTKDGVPVIIHDETLHRTTNGTGQVADYTLAELRQFRLPNGEYIPTLADFLQLVGTAPVQLNLEFKTDVERYPGIEETVLPLVKEAPLAKPVIFSSFNLASLLVAQSIDPGFEYCYLTDRDLKDPDAFCQEYQLAGIHPHHYLAGATVPQRIWTVNDPAVQADLFRRGVAGIFTDDFERAQQVREEWL
ncbi:glycerophosphodiester phosphodiesterase [Limosilactobacillus fermentum]